MFITNETVSRRTANGKPTAQRYKELLPFKKQSNRNKDVYQEG